MDTGPKTQPKVKVIAATAILIGSAKTVTRKSGF